MGSIIAISSSGGHLSELLVAVKKLNVKRITFVTSYDQRSADALRHWRHRYVLDPNGRLPMYLINLFQSLYIYAITRPKIIISTGSGIAVPMLVLGYLFGSKIIYIETGARFNEFSKTGKFMLKIANSVIVKSIKLKYHHNKSTLVRML